MEQKEIEVKKLKKEIETLEKVQNNLQQRKEDFRDMQKQLEEKLEELEDKTDLKDYLEGFDKEFETHTAKRIKETPLLISLFNEFVQEIYQPSPVYKKAIKIKSEIMEEMKKTFTKEQLELVEKYQFCEDRISDDMIEQAFIYGYAMNDELKYEAIRKYQNKIMNGDEKNERI